MLYTKHTGGEPQMVCVCFFTVTAVKLCQFTHTQHVTSSFHWRLHEDKPSMLFVTFFPPTTLSQQTKTICVALKPAIISTFYTICPILCSEGAACEESS